MRHLQQLRFSLTMSKKTSLWINLQLRSWSWELSPTEFRAQQSPWAQQPFVNKIPTQNKIPKVFYPSHSPASDKTEQKTSWSWSSGSKHLKMFHKVLWRHFKLKRILCYRKRKKKVFPKHRPCQVVPNLNENCLWNSKLKCENVYSSVYLLNL